MSEITVNTFTTVNGVKIKVAVADDPGIQSANETGVVYKFLKLTEENVTSDDISSVKIIFTVDNSWILNNSVDIKRVILKRLEGDKWRDLPTELIDANKPEFVKWDIQIKTGYEAKSPGLSVFAIVGYQKTVEAKTPQDIVISLVLTVIFVIIMAILFVKHHHKL